MKGAIASLWRDDSGASAVEFALSSTIMLTVLIGIAQVGILFMANAGLRHAVGEGARYATIYPLPSDSAIQAKVNAKKFGLQQSRITGPTITHGTENGASYTEVTMSYSVPLNFVFFTTSPITLTETRRAFAS